MVKDIGIALKVAEQLALELPLSETAQALWQQAQALIPKGRSVSDMVRALETTTGVELTT